MDAEIPAGRREVVLDVRSITAAGGEPFPMIMAAATRPDPPPEGPPHPVRKRAPSRQPRTSRRRSATAVVSASAAPTTIQARRARVAAV